MNRDWRNWCTLCGNLECVIKIEEYSDVEKIINSMLEINSYPTNLKICDKCCSFLNEVHLFVEKCKESLEMFQKIVDHADNPKIDFLSSVRQSYGLSSFENLEDTQFEDCHTSKLITEFKSELFEYEGNSENSDEMDDVEQEEEEHQSKKTKKKKHRKRRDKIVPRERRKKNSNNPENQIEDEDIFEYICHVCNEDLRSMHYLIEHCEKYHDCTPAVNCVCGSILKTTNNVLVHRKKHNLKKNVKCSFCKFTFVSLANLEKHVNKLHGKNAKEFICSQCGSTFHNRTLLKVHEKSHLPMELKNIYCCDLCPKRYQNKTYLGIHMDSIHLKKYHFTCETCGRNFSNRANYKAHLVIHSDERNFECSVCHAKFKNKTATRTHMKTHFDKTFECSVCFKKFHTSSLLNSHRRTHSDERKHKCPHCPKDFRRGDHLQVHINVHTGDKPFKCKFCPRCFANNSNLRKHKLKDHPLELAEFEAKKKQEIQLKMFGYVD